VLEALAKVMQVELVQELIGMGVEFSWSVEIAAGLAAVALPVILTPLVAVILPLEYIFLETDDAGYSIQQVYEQAALIRNIHRDTLKSLIPDNFARCFKIT